MADVDGWREVTIETVAEVVSVARETISVVFHADERTVQLLADQRYDIHSITFPVSKAPDLIAALQGIVDAEAGAATTR